MDETDARRVLRALGAGARVQAGIALSADWEGPGRTTGPSRREQTSPM